MDVSARIDPQLTSVLAALQPADFSDLPTMRAQRLAAIIEATSHVEPDRSVVREDVTVPGEEGRPPVLVRTYRPADAEGPLPCLYWIHGGGHVLGSIEQDDVQCDHFVTAIGCVVVSVEWRHSPENPYPAEIDDCYTGLVWTARHAGDLGVDAERIAVGGRSSGGGAAAGLALLARDRGGPAICHQLLIYPMLDDRNETPSSHLEVHPGLWTRETNITAWRAYLGDSFTGSSETPIYAAPSRAADLSGLPTTTMVTGELDLFRDEDVDYAARLLQAGITTELHVYPGAYHGFDVYVPSADVSHQATRDIDDALRRALST